MKQSRMSNFEMNLEILAPQNHFLITAVDGIIKATRISKVAELKI